MVVMGGMALGGVILLNAILPWLITFFGNLVQAISLAGAVVAVGAILVALLAVVFNPKTWTLAGVLYKMAIRKIYGAIVQIDPIGIMKDYVSTLKKKLG